MAKSSKSPSLTAGGVADGLISVWRSKMVSPTSNRIGGTDGSCMAASAAMLTAGVPAVVGLAGCPARPNIQFA
eukprot:5634188-Pyramimonas_sp.AAC.1